MNEKEVQFYESYVELMEALTDQVEIDIPSVYKPLEKLCKLFNICKGITSFYESVRHEQLGKGEHYIPYDTKEECVEVKKIRVITSAMTVATCTIYQAVGADPIPEEDLQKVELIMRSILSIMSRHRLMTIIEKLSFIDGDGYRNLRYFMKHIDMCEDEGNIDGKIAVNLNLRNFSTINQDLGRFNGDRVMRKYIDYLQELIGDGVVCRLGGDGFLMLFDSKHMQSVINAFNGTPIVYDEDENKRVMISAWAGIYIVPENYHEHAHGIMDKIISTLQEARTNGKMPIVFYTEMMDENRQNYKHIETMFPEAMKNEEFMVYYQPKINIESGEICGAEALCRWLHEGKIIQPNDFIPVLEMSSDICKLDFYMLEHVCKDIRRWLDEGRKVVRVSVNLSRKHMIDMDLVSTILNIVNKYQIPHRYIEVELTETTVDVEFRDLKRVVNGLQMEGIYTSVDDFGTGYSSLNLIKEVPWNVLKVDRSFIPLDDDDNDSIRSIMFKYVVAMAKELGLECIAEGVETHKQLEALKCNHCSQAQGFYFDKPLPKDEFEDRLDEKKYEVA